MWPTGLYAYDKSRPVNKRVLYFKVNYVFRHACHRDRQTKREGNTHVRNLRLRHLRVKGKHENANYVTGNLIEALRHRGAVEINNSTLYSLLTMEL
jgi:hypothetical protein